jgi:uncharacterized protein (TIGR02270 family)
MPIISAIVEQHAEEAAFLWLLRDRAVRAPHYRPDDLKRLDNRVEAHLDGLSVAGDAGWDIAWAQAEATPEPGELFAVGVLAFESGNAARIEKVLSLAVTKPELGRAVVSALGWLPANLAPGRFAPLLNHTNAAVRRIGLAGYAIRRLNPGAALEKALNDPDHFLRARALKMVGEMSYVTWLPLLKKHFTFADLPCRFYAAWSAALIAGDSAAFAELQTIALTESQFRRLSADMAVRRLDVPAANRWLAMLASLPGHERLAIHCMSALGDPASMPRLLEWLTQPPLARAAGEAFSFMTGVDLNYERLDANQPEGFEPGPTENPLDEDVSIDPDDGLPWPDPAKVSRWWSANSGRFTKGTRYLCGKPMTLESLQTVVQNERQRHRAAAAIELAIRQPKMPMIEVRARAG